MQQQIASYLFQKKYCPLPGLGTLAVKNTGAVGDFMNKLIAAPDSVVEFSDKETDTAELLNYLVLKTGANSYEVSEGLNHFCNDVKEKLANKTDVQFLGIGSFSVNESGKINFKAEDLPTAFIQPVVAERVIHPDAEHQIRVGDRETTNTVMTELLAPKIQITDRWWIWAIILGVAGLLMLIIYFTEFNGAAPFGNVIKIN